MDKFKHYIDRVLCGVRLGADRRKELEAEIFDHLEMLKADLMKDGKSAEEAENESIEIFGDAEYMNKVYKRSFSFTARIRDAVNRNRTLKELLSWVCTFVVIFIFSMSLRSYAFAATAIKQSSMQDTLYEGQRVLEWKIEYFFSNPQRGDIVIINKEIEKGDFLFYENTKEFFENLFDRKNTDDYKRLVKRIIGVPGDIIDIRDGEVYVNNSLLDEPYIKGKTYPRTMSFPITIPDGYYFVMGDNRENSLDSRDIGLIPKEKIEGKAIFRLWPISTFGVLE